VAGEKEKRDSSESCENVLCILKQKKDSNSLIFTDRSDGMRIINFSLHMATVEINFNLGDSGLDLIFGCSTRI
jgi:hypothetical protein